MNLNFLIKNEFLFFDWYYRIYGNFYCCDFENLIDCPESILLNFHDYILKLNNCSDSVLKFELRGDDYKMLEDLKKYISEDREDLLSWISYIQSDIFDLLNK